MSARWIVGLWRQRWLEQLSVAVGIALTVAMLAILGVFFATSSASMTARAIQTVSPDWQVQVASGSDAPTVSQTVRDSSPVKATSTVGFASLKALSATTGSSEQVTGQAVAVGLAPDYLAKFPAQVRLLQGDTSGVMLAQQTAANLHAKPGDRITLQLLDGTRRDATVGGIIDMPLADSFFQLVGGQATTAPRAPPDNVVLLPMETWQGMFTAQLAGMPGTAFEQVHVALDNSRLPRDPVGAFDASRQAANFTEAQLAGQGVIGNNLAVRLDAARGDALYMKVLFLFLGLPGAILSILFSASVIKSGLQRHLRDAALLRMRGYGTGSILITMGTNAMTIGVLGISIGLAMAVAVSTSTFGAPAIMSAWLWFVLAALTGATVAVVLSTLPAWQSIHRMNVLDVLQGKTGDASAPMWRVAYLDVILVALGLLAFWLSASTGYQVVVAPEGVPSATVDYKAFLAPALLWTGGVLLLARLWSAALGSGRTVLEGLSAPLAGALAKPVASFICHNRRSSVRGVALLALAFSFAVSTAIFNTTYEQQAGVDAMLTNGADVAVTGTMQNPAGPVLPDVQHQAGVTHAEAMMHRYAYVGTDLQDFYGIDPNTIGKATAMSDAYFGTGTAKAVLAKLAATPDGVLVSDETVKDFQLALGDRIKLRLQDAASGAYKEIPFTFVGIVREFPTAPRDSFLVANASYVAAQTGNASTEIVLAKTSGDPAALASALDTALKGRGFKVTDVTHAARLIGSTLTAVDLRGLGRIELIFAVPLAAGAIGIIYLLSIAERRRSFTILEALGANARQRGAFRWSEAILVFVSGSLGGTLVGAGLAFILVKLMTGVFDPPPDYPAIPWDYGGILFAASVLFTIVTIVLTGDGRRIDIPTGLKDRGA